MMSGRVVSGVVKIKSRKKRIAVRLLAGFLVLFCIHTLSAWVRAANCRIFIEQSRFNGLDYEAETVEIISLKDKAMILQMFDKRYIAKGAGNQGALCTYGNVTIAIMNEKGKTVYFSPTSCCNIVNFGPDGGAFFVWGIDKHRLNKLVDRYPFPEESL